MVTSKALWGSLQNAPRPVPTMDTSIATDTEDSTTEQREADRSPKGWGGVELPPSQPPLNGGASDFEPMFCNSEAHSRIQKRKRWSPTTNEN